MVRTARPRAGWKIAIRHTEPKRSNCCAHAGSVHSRSRWTVISSTFTTSAGPLPATWYARSRPPHWTYRISGGSIIRPKPRPQTRAIQSARASARRRTPRATNQPWEPLVAAPAQPSTALAKSVESLQQGGVSRLRLRQTRCPHIGGISRPQSGSLRARRARRLLRPSERPPRAPLTTCPPWTKSSSERDRLRARCTGLAASALSRGRHRCTPGNSEAGGTSNRPGYDPVVAARSRSSSHRSHPGER